MRGTYVRATWRYDPHLYAPARYRKACAYEAFVPDAVAGIAVRLPGSLAALISEAETAVLGLNAELPALAPLARLLLRTESIASSKVEGLQVDARALARAEAKQDAGRQIGADAIEILGSMDAMELAVERATDTDAIGAEDILKIHAALLDGTMPSIAGKIRATQNWIGGNDYNPCGAAYVPPPAETLTHLMADLQDFCNQDDLPPLVQAAIAHAQFETIHPFADGNGRTGRALVHVLLRRRGIAPSYVPPISVVLSRRRETYIRGLTRFREGDVDEWLTIFAESSAAAARLAQRYLRSVTSLQERWRTQLNTIRPRSDAAAWSIIDILPAHPVITVNIAGAATRRTRPAIASALDQLVSAGVLIPLSSSRRSRSWEASGLLDLIVQMEDGSII